MGKGEDAAGRLDWGDGGAEGGAWSVVDDARESSTGEGGKPLWPVGTSEVVAGAGVLG